MQLLSALSGIVFVVAFIPYIRAILRPEEDPKKTRPQKASWIIWATLDSITLAGMVAKDSVNGQIVGAIIGAWMVAALAMKYGKPGWTWLDKLCLGGAALAIILWQVFDSPVIGLATSLTATFIGLFPTFRNTWSKPEEEDKIAWTLYWISCVLAVAAAPSWTLADAAQPLTFFAIESIVMLLLFIKPRLETAA